MVTASTVDVMQREFVRARDMVARCLGAELTPRPTPLLGRALSLPESMPSSPVPAGNSWKEIFVPESLQIASPNAAFLYLTLGNGGGSSSPAVSDAFDNWTGYAESRFRGFTLQLLRRLK
jgi:hypothetical protein